MDKEQNFNTDYQSKYNIEEAFRLEQSQFTHQELLSMLLDGSISERQIAALKFDKVCTKSDILALISNLTGCDGKIREATAYKIHSLITNNSNIRSLFADTASESFAKATIDINANICRYIVNSAALLKEYCQFTDSYTSLIINFTNEALDKLDKFIFRDKKYVINKQLFKLYWCLESLSNFVEYIDDNLLHSILLECATQQEYTIREKCAQIIVTSNKFPDIKDLLINDENYYVKQILTSSKHP